MLRGPKCSSSFSKIFASHNRTVNKDLRVEHGKLYDAIWHYIIMTS